jgi:hypothetical protein
LNFSFGINAKSSKRIEEPQPHSNPETPILLHPPRASLRRLRLARDHGSRTRRMPDARQNRDQNALIDGAPRHIVRPNDAGIVLDDDRCLKKFSHEDGF